LPAQWKSLIPPLKIPNFIYRWFSLSHFHWKSHHRSFSFSLIHGNLTTATIDGSHSSSTIDGSAILLLFNLASAISRLNGSQNP
jgi:hypothetical protein